MLFRASLSKPQVHEKPEMVYNITIILFVRDLAWQQPNAQPQSPQVRA